MFNVVRLGKTESASKGTVVAVEFEIDDQNFLALNRGLDSKSAKRVR